MDKLIAEVNTKLVTTLNSVLTEEQGKVEQLTTSVGDDNSGLIKSLNDLRTKVQTLEEDKVGEDIWG